MVQRAVRVRVTTRRSLREVGSSQRGGLVRGGVREDFVGRHHPSDIMSKQKAYILYQLNLEKI